MNINRESYETYFMLYADNELSEGMRREVEAFVEQNPDLKPELEIFLSLRLEPDTSVQLGDKSFLFRQVPEQTAGLEEKMLLHLDGELPANEVIALEAAINAEPALQTEWEILKKTRLQADTEIRFPGKEGLYRHETKEIRVVRFSWIRYAAAAAVILIAGLLWLNQFQTSQYRTSLLHWDSMTKEAYFGIFGRKTWPEGYDKMIKVPDYEKALKGETEYP